MNNPLLQPLTPPPPSSFLPSLDLSPPSSSTSSITITLFLWLSSLHFLFTLMFSLFSSLSSFYLLFHSDSMGLTSVSVFSSMLSMGRIQMSPWGKKEGGEGTSPPSTLSLSLWSLSRECSLSPVRIFYHILLFLSPFLHIFFLLLRVIKWPISSSFRCKLTPSIIVPLSSPLSLFLFFNSR